MRRILDLPLLVILMGIGALAMYVPALHAYLHRSYDVARAFFYPATLFSVLVVLIGIATQANRPGNTSRSHLLALVATYSLLPILLAVPWFLLTDDDGE